MARGNEKGATTVEYAVIIALLVVAVVGGLELLGDAMAFVFDAQREQVES